MKVLSKRINFVSEELFRIYFNFRISFIQKAKYLLFLVNFFILLAKGISLLVFYKKNNQEKKDILTAIYFFQKTVVNLF